MKPSLILFAAATFTLSAVCAHARTPARSQQPARQQPQQSSGAAEVERLSREARGLYQEGKYKEALPLAERAVALGGASSPADEFMSAAANVNLAMILAALEQFDRARAAYERALPALERLLGGDHADTNQIREDLASVYFRQGENARAEQLLGLTHASRERTLGAHHDATMRALANLAYFHLAAGQAEKRDAAYLRLIDAAEKSPGELPEEVKTVISRYACAGVSHPRAPSGTKRIAKRIEEMWETRRASRPPGPVVSGGVLNGKAISKPAPDYPEDAKYGRVQGVVVVQIKVDEDGRVVEAKPLCGPPSLLAASVQAARQARFTPTLQSGQPVKVTGTISYNFVIR